MNNGQPGPTGTYGQYYTSGLAIASLVLGILGFVTCVTAPIGLVLGIVALVQMGRNPQMKGQGFAIAGIITSGVGVLMIPVLAAVLFPARARARDAAQESGCLENVANMSAAVRMYQTDWNDAYPPAGDWNELLAPLVKVHDASYDTDKKERQRRVFICPKISESTEPCYAMNNRLSGKRSAIVQSPADTVLIYESQPGNNMAGGPELLPSKPRHSGGDNIGFADGHVKNVERSQVGGLIWNPY